MKNFIIHSKKILILVLIIISVALLLIRNMSSYTQNYFLMDTYVTLSAKGLNARKSVDDAHERLKEIENKMNSFNDNSALNKKEYDEDIKYVIKKGVHYGELSNGLFDITIKPLTKLWNITSDNPKVPTDEQIKEALKLVNYKNIDSAQIDLGGIAKGYAADMAMIELKKHNITDAIINIGGNVYALGTKKIGLQNPSSQNGDYMGVITVTDTSVVTSGAYQRNFVKDGILYHHILNPKTGYPCETDLQSATVINTSSTDADALSTILFMLGKNRAIEFAKQNHVQYILIDKDNNVYYSSDVDIKITNNNFKKDYSEE